LDVAEQMVEQRVEPARRVVVRGDAREPVLPRLGDALEAAEAAPLGGHLLEPATPELEVEALEREPGEGRADGRLEVVAQVALAGRRPLRADLLELGAD